MLSGPVLAQDVVDPLTSTVIDGPSPPMAPEVITRDVNGRATIRAVAVDKLQLDGELTDDVYSRVPAVTNYIQQLHPACTKSGYLVSPVIFPSTRVIVRLVLAAISLSCVTNTTVRSES